MAVAKLWYKDVAVWREINRQIWYNDSGTWRQAKQIWYNSLNIWRQVYSLDFNAFYQGDTSAVGNPDSKSGEESPGFASISWHPDGTVSKSVSDTSGNTVTTTFTGGQWATPVIPDGSAGSFYEIKLDLTQSVNGGGATGMASGVWYNLGTSRFIQITGSIAGSAERVSVFNVTIRRVSTLEVVASGACSVGAFNQYVP